MGNQPSLNSTQQSAGPQNHHHPQHQQQVGASQQQHPLRSASAAAAAAASAASGFSSSVVGGGGGGGGGGVASPFRTLFRQPNALGLTRAELDERCKPSGLYPTCQWEEKAIRRLIGDGKIACRLKGKENRSCPTDQECPICFLNYREINVTTCCQANLCTECYLQLRPQKDKAAPCPFCNKSKFNVKLAQPLDEQAIRERELDEQRIIEATIRARGSASKENFVSSTAEDDDENQGTAPEQAISNSSSPSSAMAFGSSLEQNERIKLLRVRSSNISDNSSDPGGAVDITALAMTAEERRALEDEMRAQHLHPLALRLQAEEAERRMANEREYYQRQLERLRELRSRRHELLRHMQDNPYDANFGGLHHAHHHIVSSSLASSGRRRNQGSESGGASRLSLPHNSPYSLRPTDRPRQGRDWHGFLDALDNGSGNNPSSAIQSLDDLIVLEAALMLSQQDGGSEQAPRAPITSRSLSRTADFASGSFDPSQPANTALPLSVVGRTANSASATTNRGDVVHHGHHDDDDDDDDDEEEEGEEDFSLFSHNFQRRIHRGAQQRAAALREMFVPGMSEEDQIALAVAASLEEQYRSSSAAAAAAIETTTTATTTESQTTSVVNEAETDATTGTAAASVAATAAATSTESPTIGQTTNPFDSTQGELISSTEANHPIDVVVVETNTRTETNASSSVVSTLDPSTAGEIMTNAECLDTSAAGTAPVEKSSTPADVSAGSDPQRSDESRTLQLVCED